MPASSSEAETTPAPPEDDGEQVEPESFREPKASGTTSAAPKSHHHPPPPPSLVRSTRDSSSPGTRFELASEPRLARDLMSRKLFTIEPETILQSLEEHMDRFRFGHLPVVDGEKLVGLISHGDLLHASSSFLSDHAAQRNAIIHQVPVSRIMQRELITVSPDDKLTDVAALMWEARVGCVLVVENEDRLVGIITEGDFLRVAHFFLKQATGGS
ncbi:MAG TPA: CBS domain-containing protein [Polyangiaceae bacterium]|nr:CBS domain-containing protein [Polyangiaceae bacterium]